MLRLKKILLFFYKNFGPVIVFYIANHYWGLKPAVALSLVFSLVEIIHAKIAKTEITAFFKFSVGMTIIFGVLDLTLADAVFFKFEASLTNLVTAFYFGVTLFQSKSLLQQVAEQQGQIKGNHSQEDKTYFFRALTAIWTLYFVLKAALYLWINLNWDIERGLLMRTLIGNISLGVMLFVSVVLSRPIWRLLVKLKWMPSARMHNIP